MEKKSIKILIFTYCIILILCALVGVLSSIYILKNNYLLVIIGTMISYALIHLFGWGSSHSRNSYAVFKNIPYMLICFGGIVMIYSNIPLLADARIINPAIANVILSLNLLSQESLIYIAIMLIVVFLGAAYLRHVWIDFYER